MDEKEAGLRFVTKSNTLQEYTIASAENSTGKLPKWWGTVS